jgi:hypothetical protein
MKYTFFSALLVSILPIPALAAAPKLELNKTQQMDTACRLTFTARSEQTVESLVLETVLFETDGSVNLLTLFDFQSLPGGALRVRQFDVPDIQCDQIGQILFNGVHACRLHNGDTCEAPSVSSRTDIEVRR